MNSDLPMHTEDILSAPQGTLYAISVGPGDPELMTLKACHVLEACPVIAAVRTSKGGTLACDIASASVDLSQKRVVTLTFAMTHNEELLHKSHEEAARTICEELARGYDVAMPILGDASIYSTFHHLKPLVEAAGFSTRVICGVPSFCAIAAELGVNLTPKMSDAVHVLPTGYVDLGEAVNLQGTKIFMKAGNKLSELREALAKAGTLDHAQAVQDCGCASQKIISNLVDAEDELSYFTTVVVRP